MYPRIQWELEHTLGTTAVDMRNRGDGCIRAKILTVLMNSCCDRTTLDRRERFFTWHFNLVKYLLFVQSIYA